MKALEMKSVEVGIKISGIYRIMNSLTGDFYIGSSRDIKKRWQGHRKMSTWKKYPNNRLYQDMEKYSTDTFTFEVLEVCDNLFEREQYWIDVLKPTYNSKKSYNKENHGICGVYKITCTVTGDFYIGSSVNVKQRWSQHKSPSDLNKLPNSRMYQDMRKYGLQAFTFEVLAEFPPEHLKRKEQEAIETLHPTYNKQSAYATEESELLKRKARTDAYYKMHREEKKKYAKDYSKSHRDKIKTKAKAYYEANKDKIRAYKKSYNEANKAKESQRKAKWYMENKDELSVKHREYYEEHKDDIKEYIKAYQKANRDRVRSRMRAYNHRKCIYNGEELTFYALMKRFKRRGIPHPAIEASKYLVEK